MHTEITRVTLRDSGRNSYRNMFFFKGRSIWAGDDISLTSRKPATYMIFFTGTGVAISFTIFYSAVAQTTYVCAWLVGGLYTAAIKVFHSGNDVDHQVHQTYS